MPTVHSYTTGVAIHHLCLHGQMDTAVTLQELPQAAYISVGANLVHVLLVFHPSHTKSTGKCLASTLASTETTTASPGAIV